MGGLLGRAGLPDGVREQAALDYLGHVVTAQANMLGFQDGFIAMAVFCILPMLPVCLLIGRTAIRR